MTLSFDEEVCIVNGLLLVYYWLYVNNYANNYNNIILLCKQNGSCAYILLHTCMYSIINK